VVLKRLEHSNPQFVRCQRAVVDNAKKGFFSPKGRYQGTCVGLWGCRAV
jgi:hypothetical protein